MGRLPPTLRLCLNFFSSITADLNISSALRWAIQNHWSSCFRSNLWIIQMQILNLQIFIFFQIVSCLLVLKEDVFIFKEPLLELTIHGHGSKYTVLSGSMKPQKIWLILYSWKGIANIVGPKIKYFCFPLSDPIAPTQKSFSWFENENFFSFFSFFFSFNKIHILLLDEFSVLLCYFQRILNSDFLKHF